jgi:hypothetical protein
VEKKKHAYQLQGSTWPIEFKSSWLPASLFIPLMLVNRVLATFTETAGVELDGEASPLPLAMLRGAQILHKLIRRFV